MSTEDASPQIPKSGASQQLRKRCRAEASPRGSRDTAATAAAAVVDEKSIAHLTGFLAREEATLSVRAKEVLNKDLIAAAEAFSALETRLDDYTSYSDALAAGFIGEVRGKLQTTYRLAIKLEKWLQTLTPPLASGGNVGVSGEVQDGIFGHVHSLSSGCSGALHAMLAYEKEYAVQRTKITDELVWTRYKETLESNMLHDCTKCILQTHSDIMCVANSIANNIKHLRPAKEQDERVIDMY